MAQTSDVIAPIGGAGAKPDATGGDASGRVGVAGGGGPDDKPGNGDNPGVEKTRAWAGVIAVGCGDAVILVAAILGVSAVKGGTNGAALVVSILTSAFTAIGTLTTAYFGIKAVANTAKSFSGGGSAPR